MKRNAKLLAAAMSLGLVGAAATGAAVMGKSGGDDARESRIDRMFERYDTDGDGVIGREEALSAPTRFQRADTDGDGGLSLEEMTAAAAERAAKRAERLHARLDENADGVVDEDEMAAAKARGGHWRGHRHAMRHGGYHGHRRGDEGGDRAGRMFERLDADGDGSISREEFDARKARRAE